MRFPGKYQQIMVYHGFLGGVKWISCIRSRCPFFIPKGFGSNEVNESHIWTNEQAGIRRIRRERGYAGIPLVPSSGDFLGAIFHIKLSQVKVHQTGKSSRIPGSPCIPASWESHIAMGQNPVPPVNIPIPTKIPTKMGGEFTYQPKWDPKTALTPKPFPSARK